MRRLRKLQRLNLIAQEWWALEDEKRQELGAGMSSTFLTEMTARRPTQSENLHSEIEIIEAALPFPGLGDNSQEPQLDAGAATMPSVSGSVPPDPHTPDVAQAPPTQRNRPPSWAEPETYSSLGAGQQVGKLDRACYLQLSNK